MEKKFGSRILYNRIKIIERVDSFSEPGRWIIKEGCSNNDLSYDTVLMQRSAGLSASIIAFRSCARSSLPWDTVSETI